MNKAIQAAVRQLGPGDTGPEDAAAIALYSKLGAREDVLHADIPVIRETGQT